MNKLRIGVIGAGRMGCKHINACKALNDKVDFTGFYDLDEIKSFRVSQDYDAVYYNDVYALIEASDAIVIAVPTSMHYFYGMLCADAHKHILMEKPICDSNDEASELITHCNRRNVVLQVGHIERFNPVFSVLPVILKNQDILSIDFRRMGIYEGRKMDTDVVHDLMIHDLDIMNWLVDCKINHVSAFGKKLPESSTSEFAQACISFDNNTLVRLTASRMEKDRSRSMTIILEEEVMEIDMMRFEISSVVFKNSTFAERKIRIPARDALHAQLTAFISAIKNERPVAVDGYTALKALEIADQITKIVDQGVLPHAHTIL